VAEVAGRESKMRAGRFTPRDFLRMTFARMIPAMQWKAKIDLSQCVPQSRCSAANGDRNSRMMGEQGKWRYAVRDLLLPPHMREAGML